MARRGCDPSFLFSHRTGEALHGSYRKAHRLVSFARAAKVLKTVTSFRRYVLTASSKSLRMSYPPADCDDARGACKALLRPWLTAAAAGELAPHRAIGRIHQQQERMKGKERY